MLQLSLFPTILVYGTQNLESSPFSNSNTLAEAGESLYASGASAEAEAPPDIEVLRGQDYLAPLSELLMSWDTLVSSP